MAKLTISDAARACRVARSTLQRAVSAGRLSLDADHQVDTAELLRAGYTLHDALPAADRRRSRSRSRMRRRAAAASHQTRQGDATLVQHALTALERENALLRTTLDAALEREALLLRILHESQQRYDRLLDAPRAPVVPPDAPPPAAAPPL